MNKIQEIFKAWNIAFDPNQQQSELASKRIEICNSCDKKVTNLGVNRCSVCGCALKGKVFSPVENACPEGKWKNIDKEYFNKEKIMSNFSYTITKDDTIFIQIASYRDPQLIPTLDDLFSKAKYPDNIKVCIAWQHSDKDKWDNVDKYKDDSRVSILDIPYKQAKGACWARNKIQQEYNGERYTLQLDSHHRFIKNWDLELIYMYQKLRNKGVDKPLLTSYISSFNPENDPEDRGVEPWWMTFDRFTPEGVVFFLPAGVPDWKTRNEPIKGRFYSAHFAFTAGEFSTEVQHDPQFYFHGEEITIGVRAFTHGYDIYHPHKIIAYHEYTRKGRTKHWDDSSDWTQLNTNTHKLTRELLGIDGQVNEEYRKGKYGFGSSRTLQEYERYAGIRFNDRGVQQYTLSNKIPPNPEVEDYNNSFFSKFKHCLDVHKNDFPEDDYSFAAVIFEDKDGKQIFRKDLTAGEIKSMKKSDNEWMNIWREYTGPIPHQWIVWPHSESKGWGNKITTVLNG